MSGRIRRRSVAVLVLALVMATAGPASAGELEDALARAAAADFTGQQVVACATPDGDRSEIFDVQQTSGFLLLRGVTEHSEAILGRGRLLTSRADRSQALRVFGTPVEGLSSRYTVVDADPTDYLDRPAFGYEIVESGFVRARLLFDAATGALVLSDVFNADGSLYCSTRLVAFEAGVPARPLTTIEGVTEAREVAALGTSSRLPAEIAGFTLADVYPGPGGGEIGYYRDGLFSFTLLSADRPLDVVELRNARTTSIGDRDYRRSFLVGTAAISWDTSDGGYVLLGDLPLDLQASVLDELPAPARPNLLQRIWRALFG